MATHEVEKSLSELRQGRLVRVGSYWNINQADLAVTRLKLEGIPSSQECATLLQANWCLANAVGGVKVFVEEADAAEAGLIVRSLEQQCHSGEPKECSTCGESLPAGWEQCWKCFDDDDDIDRNPSSDLAFIAPGTPEAAIAAAIALLFVLFAFGASILLLVLCGMLISRLYLFSTATSDIVAGESALDPPQSTDDDDQELDGNVIATNDRIWKGTVFCCLCLWFLIPVIGMLIISESSADGLPSRYRWRRRLCWFIVLSWLGLLCMLVRYSPDFASVFYVIRSITNSIGSDVIGRYQWR